MDVLDKFFKKFSYKFDKGYPDMNNVQDVLLLESLLSEILNEKFSFILTEGKAEDRNEAKDILKKELSLSDSDFKDNGLNFYVLVPNSERMNTIDKIENINTGTDKKFDYISTPTSFSSIGYFMYGQSKFGIKPSEKQGGKSAGLGNEDVFVSEINNLLQDGPKDVKIVAGNKTVN
jgi:hypothetical protein